MPRIEPIDMEQAGGRARELRGLGYSDEQIAEVVGLVALQLLTGAFDLVAGIEPAHATIEPATRRTG